MQDNIKLVLYQKCEEYLKTRLDALQDRLDDINDSLERETKSSAGDKYETGRAMLHLEKDKHLQQLAVLLSYKKQLHAINPEESSIKAEQGALVKTNHGAFYLSISAGKIIVGGQTYFAITLASPIGQLLFQKEAGEQFEFRGRSYELKEVC